MQLCTQAVASKELQGLKADLLAAIEDVPEVQRCDLAVAHLLFLCHCKHNEQTESLLS